MEGVELARPSLLSLPREVSSSFSACGSPIGTMAHDQPGGDPAGSGWSLGRVPIPTGLRQRVRAALEQPALRSVHASSRAKARFALREKGRVRTQDLGRRFKARCQVRVPLQCNTRPDDSAPVQARTAPPPTRQPPARCQSDSPQQCRHLLLLPPSILSSLFRHAVPARSAPGARPVRASRHGMPTWHPACDKTLDGQTPRPGLAPSQRGGQPALRLLRCPDASWGGPW